MDRFILFPVCPEQLRTSHAKIEGRDHRLERLDDEKNRYRPVRPRCNRSVPQGRRRGSEDSQILQHRHCGPEIEKPLVRMQRDIRRHLQRRDGRWNGNNSGASLEERYRSLSGIRDQLLTLGSKSPVKIISSVFFSRTAGDFTRTTHLSFCHRSVSSFPPNLIMRA